MRRLSPLACLCALLALGCASSHDSLDGATRDAGPTTCTWSESFERSNPGNLICDAEGQHTCDQWVAMLSPVAIARCTIGVSAGSSACHMADRDSLTGVHDYRNYCGLEYECDWGSACMNIGGQPRCVRCDGAPCCDGAASPGCYCPLAPSGNCSAGTYCHFDGTVSTCVPCGH